MASSLTQISRKIFGSRNERELKRMRPAVERINELETEYQALSDDELRSKIAEWKTQLSAIQSDLRIGRGIRAQSNRGWNDTVENHRASVFGKPPHIMLCDTSPI